MAELALVSNLEEISDGQAEWGIEMAREILPYVSDCNGLSLMVKTLSEDDVVHIPGHSRRGHGN
ncbi:hypothetical protein [Nonomuraea sp. NPDC049480]|uniref:hypothetical protein n=1 Tax=Nonomuraea sp. NPDC049480 TaxID=3364353 RepID=UPI0037A45042